MQRALRIITIALLLAVGGWLALRAGTPAPEGAARRDALAALAPARPRATGIESSAAPEPGSVAPVRVNLQAVPVGANTADGLHAQWLRGEVDLTETESILSAAEIAALQERALALPPSPALVAASAEAGSEAPVLGVGWPSLNYLAAGGWVPPDPELAVGRTHVIAVVNSAFAIYTKSGALVGGPYDFATFMGANPNCADYFAFDPNVLYDEETGRFVLGIDSNGVYYCLAATASANPLGDWNVYDFLVGSGARFFDYPHAAVGDQYIFAGANIFTNSFLESRVYAFDKMAMYAGDDASWAVKPLPASSFTPIPMAVHGYDQGTWYTGANHYFITNHNYNGVTNRIWRWANPLGGGTPVAVGTVNLQSYTGVTAGLPVNAPQQGSSASIQANDWRPHDFEYRNGFAWTVDTIACNPGSGTVNCLRWAKIDPATATIVDGGVYAHNGQHRIFPNLAVNACGDMAVGYTKTSATIFPGVFVTGREDGDPPGTLQAEALIQAGTVAYTAFDGSPHRWGDYTGMTIDPDGERFWYLGQYSANTGTTSGRWATYIRAVSYPDCDTGGAPSADLSAKSGGSVGGLTYQAADIISYDAGDDDWSMLFDASDVGISANTQAFARQDRAAAPDLLYLAFAGNQAISGLRTIARHDVVLFTPTALGNTTAGSFSLYFDGSDVGLTTTSEYIDALGLSEDGRLLISTTGVAAVPRPGGGTLKAQDEDVLAFSPISTGANTAGTWALYFDGSAALPGLAAEDVTGFYDDPAGDDLYISVSNGFDFGGGLTGGAGDILRLTPSGGSYTATLAWTGETVDYGVIDAFEIN